METKLSNKKYIFEQADKNSCTNNEHLQRDVVEFMETLNGNPVYR